MSETSASARRLLRRARSLEPSAPRPLRVHHAASVAPPPPHPTDTHARLQLSTSPPPKTTALSPPPLSAAGLCLHLCASVFAASRPKIDVTTLSRVSGSAGGVRDWVSTACPLHPLSPSREPRLWHSRFSPLLFNRGRIPRSNRSPRLRPHGRSPRSSRSPRLRLHGHSPRSSRSPQSSPKPRRRRRWCEGMRPLGRRTKVCSYANWCLNMECVGSSLPIRFPGAVSMP